MQTDNLSIAACTDAATTHIDKKTSLLSCFSLSVFPSWKVFCPFYCTSLCTKHNGSSLLACVFIGPALRTLCLWVVIVSPCLCFIYAWAGCLFIYTNKLHYNVSLGICSHFASSSPLFFCCNCLLSPSSLLVVLMFLTLSFVFGLHCIYMDPLAVLGLLSCFDLGLGN